MNTKKRIKLRPKRLSIRDDSLYMHVGEERVKFTEHSLLRIADLIAYEDGCYFIKVRGRRYKIRQL